MKVTINHVETTQGMFKKVTFHEVHTIVQFNSEEIATIQSRALGNTIILERPPTPRLAGT